MLPPQYSFFYLKDGGEKSTQRQYTPDYFTFQKTITFTNTAVPNLCLPRIYDFLQVIFPHRKFIGKAVSLQAWSGPECSRKLRFPDFMTAAQDGGKVVSLKHRPPIPPGKNLVLISVRG